MQSLTRVEPFGTKAVFYSQICEQLNRLLEGEHNLISNAANTSALLCQFLPDINWVGFYLAEGQGLVLGPFQGKPACVRIPFGKGVCGTAAAEARTIVVPNVAEFPGHIACDVGSQSEIVVPLLTWGKLIGVLDIDSPSPNRFDEEDQEGIESIAAIFLASPAGGDVPDLSESAATTRLK